MRPRVLIAGDSHVQALRQGHALRPAAAHQAEFVFFAVPRPLNKDFRVEGGRLLAGSESAARLFEQIGMVDGPHLGTFDAVVLVGLSLTARSLVRLLSDMMPDTFRDRLVAHRRQIGDINSGRSDEKSWQPDLLAVPTAPRLRVQDSLQKLFRASDAHRLAEAIGSATDADIFCMPTPFVSADVLNLRPRGTIAQLHAAGLSLDAAELFHASARATMDGVASYWPQPQALVSDGFLTPPTYSTGATRLASGEPHAAGDVAHMNGAFGLYCLDALTADILARAEDAGAKAERPWPLAPHTHS